MIIYNLYINFYKKNNITCELGRTESIKSDKLILSKGMKIGIDGMVLEIEELFIDLEYDPPVFIINEEDIDIDVFLIGGDKSPGCLDDGILIQKGWYLVDGEVEEYRKLDDGEEVTTKENFKTIFRKVKRELLIEGK